MKAEENNNQMDFVEIFATNRFKLTGRIQGQNIDLGLVSTHDNLSKQFQCSLNVQNIIELKNLFQCNEGLFQFLKEVQNISVDDSKGVIILNGRHPIKKSETVEIYKITMIEKAPQIREGFESIMQHCNKQESIEGHVLKVILKSIVEEIHEISNHSRTPEELSRVVNKIECLGNQLQSIKMKTADLLERNQNLRKIAKQQQDYIIELKAQNVQLKELVHEESNKNQNKINKLYEILKDQDSKMKELTERIEKHGVRQSKVVVYKDQNLQQERNNQNETWKLLDKNAKFLKHFVVKGLNVTKEDDFIFPTILIGSRSMRVHNQYTLKISKMGILKKIYPGVCVGIIDSKHKHKQSCDNGDNVIQFSCAGKLFQSNKYIRTQSSGFEQGDIIKVKVNFQAGVITWFVNDVAKCNFLSKLLQSPDIDWRPYIFMRDKGDSIDWIIR